MSTSSNQEQQDAIESKKNKDIFIYPIRKAFRILSYRNERLISVTYRLSIMILSAMPLIAVLNNFKNCRVFLESKLPSYLYKAIQGAYLTYLPNITWHSFDSLMQAINRQYLDRPYGALILESTALSDEEKEYCLQKYKQLLHYENGDCSKEVLFLQYALKLPRNSYFYHSLDETQLESFERLEKLWDSLIIGQRNIKKQILYGLAEESAQSKRILPVPKALLGPPGTGKTSLILDFMKQASSRPICSINLASISSLEELIGSKDSPGIIVDKVITSGVSNPLLFFDEAEKVTDPQILYFLVQMTDPFYQKSFVDNFLAPLSIDLSHCPIYFSFNKTQALSPALLDRLEPYEFTPLSETDLLTVLEKKLYPEILKLRGEAPAIKTEELKSWLAKQDTSSIRQLRFRLLRLHQLKVKSLTLCDNK
ncbi:MAG: AAA family ATPase [Chlamydiales bacterium]|nr:AAA family ATPase [Chlamydiales bacterium]NCF71447.1 AAA family ATPase [Chlamydiales bacterium]